VARLDALPIDKQLVIVDDGSTDGTSAILDELAAGREDVVLLRQPNRGKGAAIQAAIPHLTGDIVVIQDADLEYDPADVRALIEPIERGAADVVFGSRLSGGRPTVPTCSGTWSATASSASPRAFSTTQRSATSRPATRRFEKACSNHSTFTKTTSRSSQRSQPRSANASSASTNCRSPTTAEPTPKAKRSPDMTASKHSGFSSANAPPHKIKLTGKPREGMWTFNKSLLISA
jgi:GT2 family glycosyltransferase